MSLGDNETTTVGDDSDEDYFLDPDLRRSCQVYTIIVYAVIGGLLCVLGCIGNILAFIVFWCDKVKSSTSLLFQVHIALIKLAELTTYEMNAKAMSFLVNFKCMPTAMTSCFCQYYIYGTM